MSTSWKLVLKVPYDWCQYWNDKIGKMGRCRAPKVGAQRGAQQPHQLPKSLARISGHDQSYLSRWQWVLSLWYLALVRWDTYILVGHMPSGHILQLDSWSLHEVYNTPSPSQGSNHWGKNSRTNQIMVKHWNASYATQHWLDSVWPLQEKWKQQWWIQIC